MSLNQTQIKLIKEIDQIIELTGLDHKSMQSLEKDARTPVLKNIKDQIIRSEIIMSYVIIDEHLSQILINYYFKNNSSDTNLWRNKKFKLFNYYIMEKLYLLNKLEHAKRIIKFPSSIENKIKKINELRNAIAHSFFPENRRVKVDYEGKKINEIDGFKKYQSDVDEILVFLTEKIWNVKL